MRHEQIIRERESGGVGEKWLGYPTCSDVANHGVAREARQAAVDAQGKAVACPLYLPVRARHDTVEVGRAPQCYPRVRRLHEELRLSASRRPCSTPSCTTSWRHNMMSLLQAMA